MEDNNPHQSHLTVHPAAEETPQSSTGVNPPQAQGERSVITTWLANLGNTIAAAVQRSLQDAGITVASPPTHVRMENILTSFGDWPCTGRQNKNTCNLLAVTFTSPLKDVQGGFNALLFNIFIALFI